MQSRKDPVAAGKSGYARVARVESSITRITQFFRGSAPRFPKPPRGELFPSHWELDTGDVKLGAPRGREEAIVPKSASLDETPKTCGLGGGDPTEARGGTARHRIISTPTTDRVEPRASMFSARGQQRYGKHGQGLLLVTLHRSLMKYTSGKTAQLLRSRMV